MVQVLCPMLVARDGEMAVLDAQLDAALGGEGGYVALMGEAGIGKSRLAAEVASRARAGGALVVVGRATPSEAATAYRPLSEATAQALRQHPVLEDPSLAPWLPALAGVVPALSLNHRGADVSPVARGEAVLHLLGALAAPDGLLVVLEDLHWADPDTMAVTEYLADNLRGHRVLLLVTVRVEQPSPALDLVRRQRTRPGVTRLDLERLDGASVTAMVRACDPGATSQLMERVSRSAEGMPLLVEELLASPGIPRSFADTVQERLARFDSRARRVLEAAAVLGRRFDWQLLAPITGTDPAVVTSALSQAVERFLLRVEDGQFRFRHALTKDAVLAELLPPAQLELAARALAAVSSAHPEMEGHWHDLAADLAVRAGDTMRAATLLTESGRRALEQGALATAVDVLERAVNLSASDELKQPVLLLVEALALAGRVDDAVMAGRTLLAPRPDGSIDEDASAQVNVMLAQAAVEAGRWDMAGHHLRQARQLVGTGLSGLLPRIAVLEAEVALAADDVTRATDLAHEALTATGLTADVRCQALEVLGRVERLSDRPAARERFEQALSSAQSAGLPIWRVRALHELGTIDMFDHLGTERLEQARQSAGEVGALSTAASIDLQLAAVGISRWEPEAAKARANSSLELAEALGLTEVRDKALLFLAEASAFLADEVMVEHYLARLAASTKSPPPMEGFVWGIRGELCLTSGDLVAATRHIERGTGFLARFPHAEPAAFRALWPLLLASAGDSRARAHLDQAVELGVGAFYLNRGLLGYADAVMAGRSGNRDRAATLAAEADRAFVNCSTWLALARALAAGPAGHDRWGEPAKWLAEGAEIFSHHHLAGLADWCRRQNAVPAPDPWTEMGVTAREADVMQLVAAGLANKEIAAKLRMSPRTVEKHVEALLRKTGARSRTGLAVLVAEKAGQADNDARNR